MVNIGHFNKLKVVKFVDFGAYLDGGNGVEILLPAKYVDPETAIGDELDVFIYTDSEDRLIATTEHPYAKVGEFAYLQVVDVNAIGAFLDWGIPGKDLLVPFSEQKVKMKVGGIYLVYVYLDDTTKRVVGSAKIEKFLGNRFPNLKHGDKVEILVHSHTDLGYKCIVDNMYHGMLYENELYKPVELGVELEAYVKHVRDDGKIDLTMSGETGERIDRLAEEIYAMITKNNGRLPVGDKSTPELIKDLLHCSKKDFKKAAGRLYKEQRIRISDDFIEIANA